MPSIFEKTLQEAVKAGVKPHTQQATLWFKRRVQNMTRVTPQKVINEVNRKNKFGMLPSTVREAVGHFWMFSYDPKTKAELPYYDRFPLVMVLKLRPDGFDGLNFHYLPVKMRFELFRRLIDYKTKTQVNDFTRIRISYNILKNTSKLKAFRPCYKRYLFTHVRSQFVKIRADEWETALFLPVHRFAKVTPRTVWRHSRRAVNG